MALVMALRAVRKGLTIGVPRRGPPGRNLIVSDHQPSRLLSPQNAGIDGQNQYVAARNRLDWPGTPMSGSVRGPEYQEKQL